MTVMNVHCYLKDEIKGIFIYLFKKMTKEVALRVTLSITIFKKKYCNLVTIW